MCKKHEQGVASANCALNRGEVDGEILSSRKWAGHEPAVLGVDPTRQDKDAQMCLSRGIIKRVTRRSWCRAIATKSGIMSRTRGSSADLPRPLPPTIHPHSTPFRPPPTYPYTRVRRRFRLLIKTRVREGFQGFLPGSPPRGQGIGGGCMGRRVFSR